MLRMSSSLLKVSDRIRALDETYRTALVHCIHLANSFNESLPVHSVIQITVSECELCLMFVLLSSPRIYRSRIPPRAQCVLSLLPDEPPVWKVLALYLHRDGFLGLHRADR